MAWLLPWLFTTIVGLAIHLDRGAEVVEDDGLLMTLSAHDLVEYKLADAIGSLEHLPPPRRRAFEYTSHFSPIPAPGPTDWLTLHAERGQTVLDYIASHPNRPEPPRDRIYIQPVGELPASRGPTPEELSGYARAFFGREVTVLPPLDVAELGVGSRQRDGHRQLHAGEVLDRLQTMLPYDAYCLIAVTLEDLYPTEDYNYVFGLARLRTRVGVFSFARYHPGFFGDGHAVERRLVVRRALKVMSHEIGHMFGLEHCIYLRCNMNGANHLAELDRAPMHLCPVCHRKLHLALGFDPQPRYEGLAEFYGSLGLDVAADWAAQRAEFLRTGVDP